MAPGAGASGQRRDVAAIGHEAQRHRSGQLGDGVGGGAVADAQPADDDGDARRVGLAGQRLRRLGEGIGRPHAVGGDFGNGAMGRHFEEFLVERAGVGRGGCVVGRGRNGHLFTLAGLAVDDGDGLGGGRRRCRLSRRGLSCRGSVGIDGDDLRRRLPVGGLGRRAGMQVDRHDDDRLAAKRIVYDHRPDHEHAEEQRQHGGHDLRRRDRDRQPPLPQLLAERRVQVIGRHNPLSAGQSLANHALGVYHGRSRAGLGRDYWLSGGSRSHRQEYRQDKKIRGGYQPPRIQPDELNRLFSSEPRSSDSAGRRHWSWCRAAGRAPSSAPRRPFHPAARRTASRTLRCPRP